MQVRSEKQLGEVEKGAYILYESGKDPKVILIATGSEVGMTMDAARMLGDEGIAVRVVSMPSCEIFERQDVSYKEAVLPSSVKARVAVEAGMADYWYKYVGLDGKVVGMTGFGLSGRIEDLYPHFGLTKERVYEVAKSLLA